MDTEPLDYLAYLLRLWRAGSADASTWRAALENPRSGERHVFGDLAALYAFLEEVTRGSTSRPDQLPAVPLPDRKETHEG